MTFAGINYIAVFAAAVASFAFGAGWYMTLSKQWLAALGRTETECKAAQGGSPLPFVICFLAELLMAWMLAGLIGHMGGVSIRTGVITGAFCWLGFVIPALATNHAFQGAKRSLTLIDGAHWLGVLLVQGLVIGALGVR